MQKRCAYGSCESDKRFRKTLIEGCHFFFFLSKSQETQEERCQIWKKQRGRPHEQLSPSKINKNTFVRLYLPLLNRLGRVWTNVLKLCLGSDQPAFSENVVKEWIKSYSFCCSLIEVCGVCGKAWTHITEYLCEKSGNKLPAGVFKAI